MKYSDKIGYYLNTKNEELKKFLINNRDGISYAALQKRTKYKKQLLVNFFNLHTKNITYEKN